MKSLPAKLFLKALFTLCLILCISFHSSAQCTLGAGDLIFTGYNQLDDNINGNVSDDSFSFLLLKDIPQGQVIFFTDLGWTGSSFQAADKAPSDAVLKWTADKKYEAGTEIIIYCKYLIVAKDINGIVRGSVTVEQPSHRTTSLALNPAEQMSLAELSGDQIFAFTNSIAAPNFLAGISINRPVGKAWEPTLSANTFASEKSTLPAALNNIKSQNLGIAYIDPDDPFSNAAPVARYNRANILNRIGLPAELLVKINNPANWEIKSDGEPYPILFDPLQTFFVNGVFIVNQPSNRTNLCPGSATTFSVNASNACSYQWEVSDDNGLTFTPLSNNTIYSNVTSATLDISNINLLETKKYRVIAYGAKSETSAVVSLSLLDATIVFDSDPLPPAPISVQYNHQIIASGGNGTYTFTRTGGTLPTGLTLSQSGEISGIPTISGEYDFDVQITDGCSTPNTATKSLRIIVGKVDQTIALNDLSKTYGDADFTLPANSSAGLPITYTSGTPTVASVTGNTVTILGNGSTVITANQAGNTSYNPAVTVTSTITVDKKAITVTAGTATKVYGQPDPAFTPTITTGGALVTGDSFSGTMERITGENVGTYAISKGTLTAGDNYTLSFVGANLSITAKPITVALKATPQILKSYDNTTAATLAASNYDLTGLINNDEVTVTGTAVYDTKAAGTGKTITAGTFVLAGADKDNYSLSTTTATTTGDVTAAPLTLALNATPAISKVYDGNTAATLAANNYSLTGIIGSDAVNVSGTAVYDTKAAGTGKTITAGTFVLAGTDKDNYSLSTTTATTTGEITAAPLTLTLNATPAISKAYNGNTAATLAANNYHLSGIVGSDAVTVSGTAVYDTKAAGTGKTITAGTFVLAGADKDNYSLSTTTATTAGDVTTAALTLALNATPAISKAYDGNTAATLVATNYSLTGIVGAEDVSVSGTTVYDTKAAGTGKTITANNFVLAGADKDNYSLSTTTATTTGDITTAALTLALNATPAISKAYDGNTAATLVATNYNLTGIVGAEEVSVSGTTVYDTKTAGTGKTITAGTFVLAGADKDNYSLSTTTATTTGDITAATLTLALNATPAISKAYDGNTAATLVATNYSLTGIVGAEDVSVSGTTVYDTKAAGTGKTITANNFVLAGADKDNYSLSTTTATTTGDITTAALTLALNATPAISKAYDGNTAATLVATNYNLTGIVGTEEVSVSGTTVYDTKTAGTGKTITAGTFVLAGADKDNYSLSTTTATTTGDITAATLSLALNATPIISKVYDGNTAATLAATNYSLTGIIGSDAVSVSGTAVYDTKAAGSGKTITAGTFVLAGADKDNYSLSTTTATTTGNVTTAPLTLALNVTPTISKVYDGNTAATLAANNYNLTGIVGADEVSISGTANYNNKAAGPGKTITANNFVLAGADKDNYSLGTTTATTTGDITAVPLTLTLNATPSISKIYDGNTAATLATDNYNLTGIIGNEEVIVSGTASYNNKAAGTGKTITANNFVLAGADKDNYSLSTTTATTTGDITAAALTLTLNSTPAISKVYDNNTAASLTAGNYQLNGLVGADAVSVSGTAVYDTKAAGSGKTITANNFVLAGADKDNYSLSSTTATTTGDITAATLTLALNATPIISKVYDGTTAATLAANNYNLTGIVGSDAVSISGTANYNNKAAGTGKTITANNFVLAGADKDNYSLATTTATTTGNVIAAPLTLTLNVTPYISKLYNGNTAARLAAANYKLTGIIGVDAVSVSGTANYNNKDVGYGKALAVNNFVLAGADKDNYSLSTTTATTTGDITPALLTLNLNATPAISKVYDGNTAATLAATNYNLTGIVGADEVSISGTANYNNKTAGPGKTITADNFVLAGADKDNYSLGTTTATTTGDITTAALTLALKATPIISKIYDATIAATLPAANYALTGVIGSDAVTVSGTAVYDTKAAGTGKTITANNFVLAGADKGNYSLSTSTASTSGNISKKDLRVTADDKTKYQGTANPALTLSYSEFANGEDISNLSTAPTASTVADINSGIGDYDITVNGGVAADYNFIYQKGTLKVLPGAPTNILLAAVPLYENRPAGTSAGTLSATSNNPTATFTYSLVAGAGDTDNSAFSIVGNQIRSTAVFDFETKASYSIRVRSTTQFGLSLDKQFTIDIIDINESPTLDLITAQTICYTTSAQSIPLSGISAGPETHQTTTLALSSSNANLFQNLSVTGTGTNGTISYRIKNGATGTATVTVTVKDNGGVANGGVDSFSRTFVITVNPLPVVAISADKGDVRGNNTDVSKGETVLLTATGGSSYAWSAHGSIISGQNSATLTVRPRETTTYTVKVTNASGCSETGTFTVTVLDDLVKIKATNILSPNGDGYNDKWIIENIDFYPNNEVKIFDRSGRQLYSKKGYDNSWDGTLNGTALAEGTYFYVIDFGNNRLKFKGYITIIREN